MKIAPKQYAILLYEMTHDKKGAELANAVKSFVQLLMNNRVTAQLARIERMYRDYYNAQEGIIDVEITTAREAPRKALAEIGKQLEKTEIEMKVCADPSVLGGARIRAGDYMIDDTLKARLTQLKRRFIS